MEKIKFSELKSGDTFIWDNWMHYKTGPIDYISFPFSSFHLMVPDEIVVIINDADVKTFKSSIETK